MRILSKIAWRYVHDRQHLISICNCDFKQIAETRFKITEYKKRKRKKKPRLVFYTHINCRDILENAFSPAMHKKFKSRFARPHTYIYFRTGPVRESDLGISEKGRQKWFVVFCIQCLPPTFFTFFPVCTIFFSFHFFFCCCTLHAARLLLLSARPAVALTPFSLRFVSFHTRWESTFTLCGSVWPIGVVNKIIISIYFWLYG